MRFVLCFLAIAFFAGAVQAEEHSVWLVNCDELEDCFSKLDAKIESKSRHLARREVDQITEILRTRGGEAARAELIEKALNGHEAWRRLAGRVLAQWGGWTSDDLPQLQDIWRRDRLSSIGFAIAEIRTPEALQILFDHMLLNGTSGRAFEALRRVGAPAYPLILPNLLAIENGELPEKTVYGGEPALNMWSYIWKNSLNISSFAPEWTDIALDEKRAVNERIAALKGIAALEVYAHDLAVKVRPLQKHKHPKIARQAFDTLAAIHDQSVAEEVFRRCFEDPPYLDDYDLERQKMWRTEECLWSIGEFGTNAQALGPQLVAFLQSPHDGVQLQAIEALADTGYKQAAPDIQKFLYADDWRKGHAAITALGKLKAKESAFEMERASRGFWLNDLSRYAKSVAHHLLSDRPANIEQAAPLYILPGDCKTNAWYYEGRRLQIEGSRGVSSLDLSDGRLVGVDGGEWGGTLAWHPKGGEPEILHRDNTLQILPTEGGYISVHGGGHFGMYYGDAMYIWRQASGDWRTKKIAVFTGMPEGVVDVGDGAFVARVQGRGIEFTKDGIVEELICAS